jgi:hypothetical protein
VTAPRRDGNESPFSAWVREHPELESKGNKLSVTDSDLWCHRFSLRDERRRTEAADIRDALDSIMLVEVKTFMADQSYAQRDTLTVIDALMRLACTNKNGKRKSVTIKDGRLQNRSMRRVRCFGVHLLELSSDRPDDSDQILWDKRHFLQEEHLIELLRFERDPDSPSRSLDTRRHHNVTRSAALPLGLVGGSSA